MLNFKKEKHQEVLKDLAAKSDILVENFKAGTLDRLNCGYETLKPLNSRLIYCSITVLLLLNIKGVWARGAFEWAWRIRHNAPSILGASKHDGSY